MPRTKDLHEVVIDALKLYADPPNPLPDLRVRLGKPKRRLVAASGNGLAAGKIIFDDEDAVFADEGQYQEALRKNPLIDQAVVISASGKKDAPGIVRYLTKSLPTYLLTCDRNSKAAKELLKRQHERHLIVTSQNDEPITYNTSSYLGMILAKTQEDAKRIHHHIQRWVEPHIPQDLRRYRAFYLIVQPRFHLVREMLLTKFDELFGPKLSGRCYTWRQTRHAKTLVPWDREFFISFGYKNNLFGHEDARLHIPIPEWAGYAAVVAIGYYIIGRIQAQFPAWFKRNADTYKTWQDAHFR